MERTVDKMKEIRLIEKEDLSTRYKAASDPNISMWLMLHHVSKARTENWFQSVTSDNSRLDFTGLLGGVIFGFSGLTHINHQNRTAEVYIFLADQKYFSKGLGSWLLKATLDIGFREIGITKFYARVVSENDQSKKIFLRNNFKTEGVLKKEAWINGSFHDIVLLALILEERIKVNDR